MSHYETLDVSPDATRDEIRAAFRRKAKKHHPDKEGGCTEKMAETNKAYAVLSDGVRRAKYDKTGDSAEVPSVDAQAKNLVMSLFNNSLENDIADPVAHAKSAIDVTIAKITKEISRTEAKIVKLEKRKKTVKAKGVNLFANLIDSQVEAAKNSIVLMKNNSDVGKAALVMLKDYTVTLTEEDRMTTQEVNPFSNFFQRGSTF